MRAVASLISDVGVLKKAGLVSLITIYNGWRFQHHDDQFATAMKDVADSIFIFIFILFFTSCLTSIYNLSVMKETLRIQLALRKPHLS